MEDGLVHFIAIDSIDEDTIVLILVVMEDGLVQAWMQGIAKHFNDSLNPCCDGRWSRTSILDKAKVVIYTVLILVVMEDGLVLCC